MPTLNFLTQFADDVERGNKTQTIRCKRKRPIRPGDRLVLYTGMRTRACRRLGDVICKSVRPITIDRDAHGRLRVIVDGDDLRGARLDMLVWADGFAQRMEMRDFFAAAYGLPFHGELISW